MGVLPVFTYMCVPQVSQCPQSPEESQSCWDWSYRWLHVSLHVTRWELKLVLCEIMCSKPQS